LWQPANKPFASTPISLLPTPIRALHSATSDDTRRLWRPLSRLFALIPTVLLPTPTKATRSIVLGDQKKLSRPTKELDNLATKDKRETICNPHASHESKSAASAAGKRQSSPSRTEPRPSVLSRRCRVGRE